MKSRTPDESAWTSCFSLLIKTGWTLLRFSELRQCWSLVDGWKLFSKEYAASVFRTEIILYSLHIRVHHDAKPSNMAHGDASSSYSGGVPGSNLGLDIECSEGIRAFSQSLQVNART